MRYLAFDLGDKRTGIAAGDDLTRIVSPIDVVAMPRGRPPHQPLIDALMKVISAHKPDALVLGMPVNMDDTEGPAAKSARAFGELLQAASGLPVHVQDERLTSYAADQAMAQTGRTHKQKKHLRDALAAAEILRDYLDSRPT